MLRRLPSTVSAFTVLVFVFLYLPIVVVVINSVNADKFLVSWGGFTTKWYAKALGDERVRTDFITSAKVAVASSLISVAIAVAASLWARTPACGRGGRWTRPPTCASSCPRWCWQPRSSSSSAGCISSWA